MANVGWITPGDVDAHQAYMRTLGEQLDAAVAKCFAADAATTAEWTPVHDAIGRYVAMSSAWLYASIQLLTGKQIESVATKWVDKVAAAGCPIGGGGAPAPTPPEPATPGLGLGALAPMLPGSIEETMMLIGVLLFLARKTKIF